MKNILGHDDESEIFTIIKRLRENKFSIIDIYDNSILFEITLTHITSVPVSNTTYTKIKFIISNDSYFIFKLQQINGKPERIIPLSDGYIIWCLLEEKCEI